jgi:hypothetical protein
MDQHPSLPPPPPGGPSAEERDVEPQGPSRSVGKAIAVVAAFLVAITGIVVLSVMWLGAPGRCDTSTVESERFGYCVEAPGWELTNDVTQAELPYDELIKPADASTVRIQAIQLQSGVGLNEIVQGVRDLLAEDGVDVGEVVDRRVAGVPAAQFDYVLEGGTAEQQVRDVVFVRGDAAWHVQFTTDLEGFEARAAEFEDILRTWIFR